MNGHNTDLARHSVCTRSRTSHEIQRRNLSEALNDSSNGHSCCHNSQSPVDASDVADRLSELPVTPNSSPRDKGNPENQNGTPSSPQTGPTTPHKIQALNEDRLRLDAPLSPPSALSKLKLISPNKLPINKVAKVKQKYVFIIYRNIFFILYLIFIFTIRLFTIFSKLYCK